jgi:IS30 family transposase
MIALESEFNIKIYYCHPYCSYERGTVERKNRNLLWYYPKGTDFGKVPGYEIIRAQNKINNRPMKCLRYRTPTEVWSDELVPT